MSYLLRNRNSTPSLNGGGSHGKGSRFLPPNRAATQGSYRLSSGGAQVQIQRQQQSIQQKLAPPQHQQQTRGVISMEEVLADLRILETQQQESERKLHHARITKQRRLEQQRSLEERLDKFKYQNGQQRAELQRAHELLSEGQRQLSSARTAAAKAGDDLREFDRKLKMALEVKFSLITHQKTQDRLIEVFHKKVAEVGSMKRSADHRLIKAKQDLQNSKRLEEALRFDISNELVRHQRIADQTAKVDAEYSEFTAKLATNSNEEVALKLQIEAIEKEGNVLKFQEAKSQESFKLHQEEHKKFMLDISSEHDCHKNVINEKTSRLRHLWHNAASVQKSEGHTPDQLPSESSCPPILDLVRIRDSLNAELGAVSEESIAKEQLSASVEELKKKSASLQQQLDKNSSILAEIQAINLKQLLAEDEMQVSNDELRIMYECICKSVDEKMDAKRQHLTVRNVEVVEFQKLLDSLSHNIREANSIYKSHRACVSAIDDAILDIKTERDELKNRNQHTLSKLEDDLAILRNKVEELRDAAKKESCDLSLNEVPSEERIRLKQIERAKTKISNLLEAYPEIEKISIHYRPDLSDHEQGQIDLKRFVKKCKNKILSLDAKIDKIEKAGKQKFNVGAPEMASSYKKKPITTKSVETDRCNVGGKSVGESMAKPRSLLPSFLRENNKDAASAERRRSNPEQPDMVAMDANPASAKKVRWHQDCGNSDGLETIEFGSQTAVEMVKGSAKRKAFGSKELGGPIALRGTKAKKLEPRSRSLSVDSSRLLTSKKYASIERIGDKRSCVGNELGSEPFSKFDLKRRRVSSVDCSKEAPGIKSKALSLNSNTVLSSVAQPKIAVKQSTICENDSNAFGLSKQSQATQKYVSYSAERDESKTQKKRVSSTQFSGISSQERPSKGRRRKRALSGTSVGSKPGRTTFVEEEYSFNFTN